MTPLPACLVSSALLLLAACGPAPDERAKADALRMLAHERHPPVKPAVSSLKVHALTNDQVRYYSGEVGTFGAGHLVTYTAARDSARAPRQALFVADNDSAFFFLPARHATEFERAFGVRPPAAGPDPAAARLP